MSKPAGERHASPSPRLLDLHQVAEQLNVNDRHVRRLVAERRIPFVKWGHLLRFDPEEIAAWLDAARCPPLPPPPPLYPRSRLGAGSWPMVRDDRYRGGGSWPGKKAG